MRNSDITHILEAAKSIPWAILPEKLAQIRGFLESRVYGVEISAEEKEALLIKAETQQRYQQQGSIAVIPVSGTVSMRMNLMSAISGGTSTELLGKQIQQAIADPSISVIVLNVDSPGGTVEGVPELHSLIMKARETKPVVASVNALSASAAYWISSAATEITMTPSGKVGSIGVFAMHQDLSAAAAAEGVKVNYISAGKYKTEGNPFEPLSDEARAAIQETVDAFYGMFVKDIAKGRGISAKEVQSGFGEGRLVLAPDAKSAGMIDRIETFDATLARLMKPNATKNLKAEYIGYKTGVAVKSLK
jgi:signal peptide peptidase SppA